MEDVFLEMLDHLEIGKSVSQGPLQLFPLLGGAFSEEGLSLLEEALQDGTLRVEERDEAGSVPELRVLNEGAWPVLVLEADELVGAKQNRVLNSTVLVAAESELVLPVSCVERGRWSYRVRAFSSSNGSPHLALRCLKSRAVHDSLKRGQGHRSDQDAVWEEVDRKVRIHGVSSPTHALQDARAHLSHRLADADKLADVFPEGTRGVVVALGDRPLLIEVLAGPRSFAKASSKLLAGYAFEAVDFEERDGGPDPSAVRGFIEAAARAPREEYPAVGSGTDLRFEAEGISGYALVGEEGVLHAAAFAEQIEQQDVIG